MTEQHHWQIDQAQVYGGVLINAQGHVLLREPSNSLAGYVWTFAKGKPEPAEQPATAALRIVYEETGYKARIIGVLPGVFKSGNSSSAFFVMCTDEAHKPGSFSWETESVSWDSFSHAKAKVAVSSSKLGRKHDLAILDAAEHWLLACLPLALLGKFPAVKTDWETEVLPDRHCQIELNFTYTRIQTAHLMLGYVPEEMEEKWFSYFENNVLYQHRSWTGFCVYKIYFTELTDGRFKATHALVNREPEQYGRIDESEDKKEIRKMLKQFLHWMM